MPTQVTNYQCPACTGPLHFDADSGKLQCDYCGSAYDVAEIEAVYAEKEQKAEQAAEAGSQWNADEAGSPWSEQETAGLRNYSCPSCGAEILCDETTAATACPYCGNPTIVPGQLGGNLKPDYVIPFKLEKKEAVAALNRHYKGKIFLPKSFKNQNHIEEIQGVYVPFWLFDGETDADITFDATRIHSHREGDEEVTITEHYRVRRKGTVCFKKVPVDGSSKMPDAHMDAIEPFDYSELKPFSTAYLPGYLADKYDVDAEACAQRADERIRTSTEEALAASVIGYASVTPEQVDIRLQRGQVKYALLPVWMLHTGWQGKQFLFAMNGQTGKLIGDLPVSKGRVATWAAGVFCVAAAVLTGLQLLL